MKSGLRKADDRGSANFGWLESKHTFSFGRYHDPMFMGFGPLRVINEDNVAPGGGFPSHPHSDMEILSYVIAGELEHKDSVGTGSIIRPGDLQRMTAGTGIVHSEYNPSKINSVHFLQIWVIPENVGSEPSYEQKYFAPEEKIGKFLLLGSRTGRNGSVTIHQDIDFYASILREGERLSHHLTPDRIAWVQILGGSVTINGQSLKVGDGLAIETPGELNFKGQAETEILLFDMIR